MARKFSPYAFLRLGRSLSKASSESRRRTAVGRLYYAVHLKARETLLRQGVSIPKFRAHKAVIDELKQQGHPQAGMVDWLRALRVDADYELHKTLTQTQVGVALILADRVWPNV